MSAAAIFYPPTTWKPQSSGRPYPSAKASFYETGTTTPKDVYTDAALSIPYTQPVQADTNGVFTTIYLDPTQTYKYTLTDQNDVLIETVDPAALPIVSQAIIGSLLYPQTAAELSAGVTPLDYTKFPQPIRDLSRTVSDNTGATDVSAEVAAAIDLCAGDGSGSELIIPTGIYKLSNSIPMTGRGVHLVGVSGRECRFYWYGNGSVFDIDSDGQDLFLENFSITNFGNSASYAIDINYATIFMERLWIESRGGSTSGGFAKAIYVRWPGSVGWDNVYLRDSMIEGNLIGYDLDGGDEYEIYNTWFVGNGTGIKIGTNGPVSSATIRRNQFLQKHAGGTTSTAIEIYESRSIEIAQNFCELAFDSNAADTGHRFVRLRGNTTGSKYVWGTEIRNNEIQGQGIANYAIEFENTDAFNVGTSIDMNTYHSVATAFCKDGGTFGYFGINKAITGGDAPHSSSTPGTYYLMDLSRVGSASATFTPAVSFGGGTTGITYSQQIGRYERIGNLIFFSGDIVLSSKGSSTGAARITGLPFTSENVGTGGPGVAVAAFGLSSTVGGFQGQVVINDTKINLYYTGTGTPTALADTNFSNTTEISFSGMYRVV